MPNYMILLLLAIFYGCTMKIADLLDEHGMKWFIGADILFGVLWGISGALLVVLGGDTIANILLAMNLAFLVRNRLDYLNHQIATSIIIFAFLVTVPFNVSIFLTFYVIFTVFGALKDHRHNMPKLNRWLFYVDEVMLYYPLPTTIYCLLYGNWIVFWIFLFYTITYDLTKYIAKRPQLVE